MFNLIFASSYYISTKTWANLLWQQQIIDYFGDPESVHAMIMVRRWQSTRANAVEAILTNIMGVDVQLCSFIHKITQFNLSNLQNPTILVNV